MSVITHHYWLPIFLNYKYNHATIQPTSFFNNRECWAWDLLCFFRFVGRDVTLITLYPVNGRHLFAMRVSVGRQVQRQVLQNYRGFSDQTLMEMDKKMTNYDMQCRAVAVMMAFATGSQLFTY